MRTVELFSGTGSFTKVMTEHGHQTWQTDKNNIDHQDLVQDIEIMGASEVPEYWHEPDILWASPPCEGFSVAAIGRNWNQEDRSPKTESARLAQRLVLHTLRMIEELEPTWWFIENPRGNLRRMPFMAAHLTENHPEHRNDKRDIVEWNQDRKVTDLTTGLVYRRTITYCQYGDTRMKPTDIWTNAPWWKPRPLCSPGADCHVAAPRGSKTGTQGIGTYKDRSRIPPALFEEIITQMKHGIYK